MYCCDALRGLLMSSGGYVYSCIKYQTLKDDNRALENGASKELCEMKCVIHASETSFEWFMKQIIGEEKKDYCNKLNKARSLLENS